MRKHPARADTYRIGLDPQQGLHPQVLAMLLNRQKSRADAAVNAVMLHRYADVLAALQSFTPEQLQAVADGLADAVEIRVSLPALAATGAQVANDHNRRQRHLQQCEWLLLHGGSNSMILLLCPTLSPEDVRSMRLRLNKPTCKGRRRALPLDERLSVLSAWDGLGGSDTFARYQQLAGLYPQYEVGQLFSVVNEGEGGLA